MYSDENGYFTLSPLKPGTHSLWATRRGFALDYVTVEVPSPVSDVHGVQLSLDTGHDFSGQVLDASGQPMAGVLIFPQTGGPLENQSDSYSTGGASTDHEGRFAFPNVRCETLSLQLFADGYATLKQDIYAGQHILLYPQRAGQLKGKVIDSQSGTAIESFVVKISPGNPTADQIQLGPIAAGWSEPGMSFTHNQGHWDTGKEALHANTVINVKISAPGYGTHTRDQVIVPAKGSADRITFSLRKL